MRTWADRSWMGMVLAAFLMTGCGGGDAGADGSLTGQVQSDGSSTVFPVAEAIAEEFQIENRGVRVTVGVSGTGGGFSRFCAGETDIANASREIRESELEACEANGVEVIEMPVAWDGLSVVVNPANDFVECLTVGELQAIWGPGSDVTTWRDVRSDFPAEEIQLYGPGTDSGTFDYFTETINGEGGASRADYQASEDDNVLVQGVSGDQYALGYFGFAYYVENQDALKIVGVDGGNGCVEPSVATVEDQSYTPLSRPLFIYVREGSLERPEVEAYIRYFMNNSPELIPATGYIPLSEALYQENIDAMEAAMSGAAMPKLDESGTSSLAAGL